MIRDPGGSTTAFVTGGTGFVGSAVVRALLADGAGVRCLARPGSPRVNLSGLPVEIVEGDLTTTTEAELARALEGCDEVHHCAALYAFWAPDPAEFERVNVAGSRLVVRAAMAAGVPRVVYTSSVATIQPIRDEAATEASWATLKDAPGHYKRSKILAEQEVLRLAREEGAPVVIVNPSAPVGARDIRPTPTGQMILDFLRGRMPAFVDTGLNIVDVDDVGRGHVLAARRGVPGRRYILGGDNLSLYEVLVLLAEIAGRKPPRWEIPHAVSIAAAAACEAWARVVRRPPRIPLEAALLARTPMWFDGSLAVRELGFVAEPARTGLQKAVEHFRQAAGIDAGFSRRARGLQ
jgi:dihydroflavonol-4-reductase